MSDSAEFTLKFTEEGLGAINTDLGRLSGNMESSAVVGGVLGGAIAEIGLKAIEMGAEAVKAIGEVAAEFGKAVIEAASFGQRMSVAFSSLLHGASNSDEVLQHTIDLAAKLGMNVDETTDAYRAFLAAQLTPSTATALVKMTADLRAAGVAGEETQRVMYTLREINDIGTLQARQLRMLEMAGVSGKLIREQLAKSLQIPEEGVDKAMAGGKIKAGLAIQAIEDAVKEKLGEANLGEAGEKFANNTLSGMWGKLQAAWQKGMLDIGKAVTPALTSAFKPIFTDIMGWMQGDQGKAFMKDVIAGVKDVAGAVEKAWPLIKEFGAGFADVFKTNLPAIKEVAKQIGLLIGDKDAAATMKDLGMALGFVVTGGILATEAFIGLTIWTAKLVKMAYDAGAALVGGIGKGALDAIHWVEMMRDNIVGAFFGLIYSAQSAGSGLIDGLVGGIEGGIGRAVKAAKTLASEVEGGIKDALGIHSPSTVGIEIGENFGGSVGGGIDSKSQDVNAAASNLLQPPSTQFNTTNHATSGGVTVHLYMNVPAGSPATQDASALASEVRRELAAALHSALAPA